MPKNTYFMTKLRDMFHKPHCKFKNYFLIKIILDFRHL